MNKISTIFIEKLCHASGNYPFWINNPTLFLPAFTALRNVKREMEMLNTFGRNSVFMAKKVNFSPEGDRVSS